MLAGGAGTEGRRCNIDLGEAGAGQAGFLALGRRIGAAKLALKVRTRVAGCAWVGEEGVWEDPKEEGD